jgi:N4-gp56 family major capsid protein
MAIKASRQDSTERKRISAELAASSGATTSSTEAGPGGGKSVSEFTATEFLERVIRDAEERRVFEDVSAVYDDLVGTGEETLEIPRTTRHLDLTDQRSTEGVDRGYQQLENLDTIETTITADSFVNGGLKISKELMMRNKIPLVEEARNAVTQQMAEDVDLALRDEIISSAPADHQIDNTASGELTPESISDAMTRIEEDSYVPRFLVISPSQQGDLRKDSQFTNASEYGDDEVIMSGEIGQYLGLSVLVTSAVSQDDGSEIACMVGESPDGEAVGPAIIYKEMPNMATEYDREESTQKIYYDHAFETNTIQEDALATIQTA